MCFVSSGWAVFVCRLGRRLKSYARFTESNDANCESTQTRQCGKLSFTLFEIIESLFDRLHRSHRSSFDWNRIFLFCFENRTSEAVSKRVAVVCSRWVAAVGLTVGWLYHVQSAIMVWKTWSSAIQISSSFRWAAKRTFCWWLAMVCGILSTKTKRPQWFTKCWSGMKVSFVVNLQRFCVYRLQSDCVRALAHTESSLNARVGRFCGHNPWPEMEQTQNGRQSFVVHRFIRIRMHSIVHSYTKIRKTRQEASRKRQRYFRALAGTSRGVFITINKNPHSTWKII